MFADEMKMNKETLTDGIKTNIKQKSSPHIFKLVSFKPFIKPRK